MKRQDTKGTAPRRSTRPCSTKKHPPQDIGQQKRAERKLHNGGEQFRAFFQGVPEPVGVYQKKDRGLVLTQFNRATDEMSHGNMSKVLNKTIDEIYAHQPGMADHAYRCLESKQNLEFETDYRLVGTDEDRHMIFTFVYVPEDIVMIHAHDITERVQAEYALKDVNLALEQRIAERTAEVGRTNAELRREIAERQRIEEELREAEQKANDLIRYAPTAIYEIDFRGPRFTRVNDAMCRMSGYSRAELLAMNPFDLMDEEGRKLLAARAKGALAGEAIDESVEYRVKAKDGREIYAALQTRRLYEGGKAIGAFVIAHDVTERKRAEEALRRSEEQYRDLVESSNSIVMRADEDLNIRYMNPFGLAYFGYTAEELIGKNVMGATIPRHDDAGRDLSAMVKEITRDPEKYKTNVHQNMRKNGELVWVSWTNKVTYDRDGRFVDILAIGNDIDQITKAEEAKRESERLLRTVLEGSPDPVYIKDRTSHILLANRALSQVVGKPLEEIVGKTDSEYYKDPAVGQRLREHDLQVMASRTNAVFEETVPTPDGERTFLSTKSPYRSAAGEIIGIVGISHDITERKNIEDALARTNRKLSEVLDSIQDDFYVLDRDWKFVYASRQFTGRVGKEPADFVGNCIWEMFPEHVGSILYENFCATMENREIRRFEVGGKYTDAWYSMTGFPSAEGITVLGRDITKRKRAEKALEAAHRRTNEILESIQDGFFALDREWRFTYINTRAAINVGAKPQELIGQNLWERFPGIVGTAHETYYRKVMDERVPMHFEMEGVLTAASYDVRVYPSPEGISVYWLDITERKQIEQKLQELNCELERQKLELQVANKELESFSFSVSHDLRAPLGSIDGFASMMLKDYGAQLPPESKSLLQLVQENAQQMSRLIEALLLLSRTSRQPLTRQSVSPGELVAEVLRMLQPQCRGRQVELEVADLAPCQADPVLLRQVYVNLLSNALKFTRSRPVARIQVGYLLDKEERIYFVKDNGVGFDMEQAGNLFGVFQRLHGEDEYEGTGIGLAIVQRIIRRHGGRVWAEAEVDKGACFYFTLG